MQAVPEEIDGDDVEASLQEIALSLRENRRMSITKKQDEALRLVACKVLKPETNPHTAKTASS